MDRLRLRVVIAAIGAVALAIALSGAIVVSTFSSREHSDLDDRLVARAEAAVDVNRPPPPGGAGGGQADSPRALAGPPGLRRLNQALQTGGEFARIGAGGRTLVRFGAPPPDAGWPLADEVGTIETVTVGGRRYRAIALPTRTPMFGGPARLEVATALAPLESRISGCAPVSPCSARSGSSSRVGPRGCSSGSRCARWSGCAAPRPGWRAPATWRRACPPAKTPARSTTSPAR